MSWASAKPQSSWDTLGLWSITQIYTGAWETYTWLDALPHADLWPIQIVQVTQCIVSPQLWMDISHFWKGPLTLGWWWLNICGTVLYNLWHPHSHLSLLLPSNHFASVQIASIKADPTCGQKSLADFHKAQILFMHLRTSAWLVEPTTVEKMWRMQ